MAKEGGGGGGFGWALLGFLAGVAATLGLQLLLSTSGRVSRPETAEAPPAVHVEVVSSAPVVKPAKKSEVAVAVPAKPAPPADSEVADDAAAAGMTSRITPADDTPSTPPAPTVNN